MNMSSVNSNFVHFLAKMFLKAGFFLAVCTLICTVNGNNAVLRSLDPAPILHFTLNRRNGPFDPTKFTTIVADLERLEQEIMRTESRFNLTKREVKGNRLVRKPKSNAGVGGMDEGRLLGEVATDGVW